MDSRIPLQHPKIFMNHHENEVFYCLPFIPDTELGDKYEDVSSAENERLTVLSPGHFLWLINIWPGYILLTIDKGVIIEPYMPSRFARQSAYDQLYVGNPNPVLQYDINYLDAARAWYYNVSECTGTHFRLPAKHVKPCFVSTSACGTLRYWGCQILIGKHSLWSQLMRILRSQLLKMPSVSMVYGSTEQYAIRRRDTRRLIWV